MHCAFVFAQGQEPGKLCDKFLQRCAFGHRSCYTPTPHTEELTGLHCFLSPVFWVIEELFQALPRQRSVQKPCVAEGLGLRQALVAPVLREAV